MVHHYKRMRIGSRFIDHHRYVMEQHLGRRLLPTEIVHHINGDKRDDRIENLELTTKSAHSKKHSLCGDYYKFSRKDSLKGNDAIRKKSLQIRCRDGKILCTGCKKYLEKSAYSKNKARMSGYQSYCKECHKTKYPYRLSSQRVRRRFATP